MHNHAAHFPSPHACSAEWAAEKTLQSNYEVNKLVLDPNEGFGRNKAPLPLKSKEERQQEEGEDAATYSDDDGESGQGVRMRT